MIEKIILDYLTAELSVPVYMEVPEARPLSFVVIEKTGSHNNFHISTATIATQSYAETMYKAASLNEAVKAAMSDIIELDSICKCSLNSDYNYTEADAMQYRYQAVFDVTHY